MGVINPAQSLPDPSSVHDVLQAIIQKEQLSVLFIDSLSKGIFDETGLRVTPITLIENLSKGISLESQLETISRQINGGDNNAFETTLDGMKANAFNDLKTTLDGAVANGKLTNAKENTLLSFFNDNFQAILDAPKLGAFLKAI